MNLLFPIFTNVNSHCIASALSLTRWFVPLLDVTSVALRWKQKVVRVPSPSTHVIVDLLEAWSWKRMCEWLVSNAFARQTFLHLPVFRHERLDLVYCSIAQVSRDLLSYCRDRSTRRFYQQQQQQQRMAVRCSFGTAFLPTASVLALLAGSALPGQMLRQ
jgi:hypothetical protein